MHITGIICTKIIQLLKKLNNIRFYEYFRNLKICY
nr:MAG TPA: hypothetical protein [Caudoviricetes sp.]